METPKFLKEQQWIGKHPNMTITDLVKHALEQGKTDIALKLLFNNFSDATQVAYCLDAENRSNTILSEYIQKNAPENVKHAYIALSALRRVLIDFLFRGHSDLTVLRQVINSAVAANPKCKAELERIGVSFYAKEKPYVEAGHLARHGE